MRWLSLSVSLLCLRLGVTSGSEETKQKKGPPPFFLQDPTDSLCLGGDEFKRCSIDTLFYVVGSPGNYQIHKRPNISPMGEDDLYDDADDGLCISKKSCNEKDQDKVMEAKLAKCSHCGAKNWNILGDAETGYVVMEGETTCLSRQEGGNNVLTAPCNSETIPYTPLQLQFASASDIVQMSSPGARLIGAASDGDKKLIQSLLKEGMDVNVRDWDDLTAIIPAASSGHLDIVKLLIKEKCDVNAKDKDGITALMEASIMGHVKIVEALLDAGATVDDQANSEVTALWLASGEGRTDTMKVLLKKGADASNTRVDGISGLMTACSGGFVDAVKLLLENGADPLAVDDDGLSPLMNAAENGTLPILKMLLDKVDGDDEAKLEYINHVSKTGFNAFIIAAAHGHADVISHLIDVGADVNAVHEEQKVTALMYAAGSGYVEAMKVLLEKGKVDVNVQHINGGTAMLEAANGGSAAAIKFLIDNGCKFDVADNDGVTPLMSLASQGHEMAQAFILDALKKSRSPDEVAQHINLASNSGGTAVMFAAAGGFANCTKALLDMGADVNAVARATPEYLEQLNIMIEEGTYTEEEPHVDGVTALHVAAQAGHLDCVKIVLEAGADVSALDDESRTALQLAVKGNFGEVAVALVEAGADPNSPYVDDDGDAHDLLMDAITAENEDFATLLVEKGADLYYADERKVTTLLQASHRGLTDIVKMLLAKHSELKGNDDYVNAASDEGIPPLIAAASEGHVEILKMLIDAKADVNAKDKEQANAIMAASARGHLKAVELLVNAGADVNEQNQDGHTALMFAYNGKNQVETLWERYKQFVAEQAEKKDGEEEDDGGTGPIIQEAMDNHTALVQLLLKSGADESLKDKEGHTAKDFDFHPDADAEVLDQEAKAEKKRDESKNEL